MAASLEPEGHGAHSRSMGHRKEILRSTLCGCFHCTKRFAPSEVSEWVDNGATALCPHCGVDAVIGDASGYPVTPEFLSSMRREWF